MFGLVHYVLMAERDWRQDQAAKTYDDSHFEVQDWVWTHKVSVLVLGVLLVAGLLVVGGNGN